MDEHDYTISEYCWKDDISKVVVECIKSYNINTIDKAQIVVLQELIHAMHGHIASLMMDVTGMREMADTDWEEEVVKEPGAYGDTYDWEEEVGNLYDFLCEYKLNGVLLDEYHEWDKKKEVKNDG